MVVRRWAKSIVWAALVLVGLFAAAAFVAVVSYYAVFYVAPRSNGGMVSSGQNREYLLHIPGSYNASTPTPLVISMHAAMLWPGTQMAISHWNELADEQGFIVVYPSGQSPWGGGTGVRPKVWSTRPDSTAADVRFISDLITRLETTYNIDPTRIYASGYSNGGGMAFTLSCTMPHRIAAVGMVAAARDEPWSSCGDTVPVPVIAFHGTADPLVPYAGGGPSWLSPRPFPSVTEWTAEWARRNRCGPAPVVTVVAADVTRREYVGCADSAAVVLYTIRGGGHTWPGARPLPKWLVGATTRSIDATELIWTFFQEHPLRAQRP